MEPTHWIDKLSGLTILPEVYKDLAQPGVRKVGVAIGDALEFSLLPTRFMRHGTNVINTYLERNLQKLQKSFDKIPDEKLIQVLPEISVPIVQRLNYTSNEDIAQLFINLLSSAANEDTVNLTHPSFIEMVSRMSSDEAKIINYLKNVNRIPFITLRTNYTEEHGGGYYDIQKNLTGIEDYTKCNTVDNINVYLDNLANLGIIYNNVGEHLIKEELYAPLYKLYEPNISVWRDNLKDLEKIQSVNWEKGYFSVTDFGQLFIKVCTSSEPFKVKKISRTALLKNKNDMALAPSLAELPMGSVNIPFRMIRPAIISNTPKMNIKMLMSML